MESLFKSGFRSFLESSYIDFIEYGNSFIFTDYDFSVELVPASFPTTLQAENYEELGSRVSGKSGTDFQ